MELSAEKSKCRKFPPLNLRDVKSKLKFNARQRVDAMANDAARNSATKVADGIPTATNISSKRGSDSNDFEKYSTSFELEEGGLLQV